MLPLRDEIHTHPYARTLSYYTCLLRANHFVQFGAHERKHLIKCIHLVVVASNKKKNGNPIGKPFEIALLLLLLLLFCLLLYWITITCNYIECMRLHTLDFTLIIGRQCALLQLTHTHSLTVNHFITASIIFSNDFANFTNASTP